MHSFIFHGWISICFCAILLIGHVKSEGPTLNVPHPWIVNYPDENFYIVCSGDSALSWEVTHVEPTFYNITNEVSNGNFESTFHIPELFYEDTGFFTCKYIETEESVSTYVFVHDGNNAFLTNTHQLMSTIIGEIFTLDCRITHPDINVTVFKNNKNITSQFEADDYGRFWKQTNSLQETGIYICREDLYNGEIRVVLDVQNPSSPLHTPSITEFRNSYHVVGDSMTLNCSVPNMEDDVILEWDLPNPSAAHRVSQVQLEYTTAYTVSSLLIYSAKLQDSGVYMCTASKGEQVKRTSKDIVVESFKYSFVEIEDSPGVLPIEEGENFQWFITVAVFPESPDIKFYNPFGDEIKRDERVSTDFDYPTGRIVFKMDDVKASDFGRYTVAVTTADGRANDSNSAVMYVKAKPEIQFEFAQYVVNEGEYITIQADILSFDQTMRQPKVYWVYKTKCPSGIGSCSDKHRTLELPSEVESSRGPKNRWISTIIFKPESPGELDCKSKNTFGSDIASTHLLVSDIGKQFVFRMRNEYGNHDILGFSHDTVVEGDDLSFECKALSFKYTDVDLEVAGYFESINNCDTRLSRGRCLQIPDVNSDFEISVFCKATDITTNTTEIRKVHISTLEMQYPDLDEEKSNLSEEGTRIDVMIGESLLLACIVEGQPKPNITWFLDNVNLETLTDFVRNDTVFFRNEKQYIEFKFIKINYAGVYTCLAENRLGSISPYASVNVIGKGLSPLSITFIVLAALVIIILVLLVGCLIFRVKQERKFRNALRKNQLYLFEKGNVGDLNQDCMLDEQAELLPYDHTYEIDRSRISVGKQLGCGAFGRVMLAEVRRTGSDGREGKVALKMSKDATDPSHLRALTAELKIMIHLGKHLNIVNLIGANTAHLDKGELWILVEYCKYGSLLNFMQKRKKLFINQINPHSGAIELHRTSPFLNDPLSPGGFSYKSSLSSKDSEQDRLSPSFRLVNPNMFRKPPSITDNSRPGFYAGNPNYSGTPSISEYSQVDVPMVPNGLNTSFSSSIPPNVPEEVELSRHGSTSSSRSSEEIGYIKNFNTDMTFLTAPALNQTMDESFSGYVPNETDIPGVSSPFSTAVLLCWAWQIACGMEYLSKRKVLHGDLAARNILLAANNIVKISDFGLSRDIYKNDIYMKKDDGAMPIKWMSLEAIEQRLFSTQSDVWAYGVTLWEIFTLGNTPYPGIAVDRDFVIQLEKGVRMSKPKYCNEELYSLMLQCWNEDPIMRPDFNCMCSLLSDMLYPDTKEHYVAMNDVLVDKNKQWFETRPDYFSLMQTPNYVNLQPSDENFMLTSAPIMIAEATIISTPAGMRYLPMTSIANSVPLTFPAISTGGNIFFPSNEMTMPPLMMNAPIESTTLLVNGISLQSSQQSQTKQTDDNLSNNNVELKELEESQRLVETTYEQDYIPPVNTDNEIESNSGNYTNIGGTATPYVKIAMS